MFPQLVKIIRRSGNRRQAACVDDTRTAHGHTVRADKVQVAINFSAPNSVNGTVNINSAVYQIHQIANSGISTLMVKVHIGDMAIVKAE